jgi:putative transposase
MQGMYRPRVEVPAGYYHLGTRGNNQRAIFFDDEDRLLFLAMLRRIARRYGWTVYAYCLMTNHYHLVIQLSDRGLSRGMCELNGGYAIASNARHGRTNHVFGRRFWDAPIERQAHLLETCRYVVLNPVRAGILDKAAEWPWSSYRSCAGEQHAPTFLAVGELLGLFGANPGAARAAYRRYVSEGHVPRQPRLAGCDEIVT